MKTATITSLSVLFSFFLGFSVSAQCPDAATGFHRVQKGETLYRISKKHKVSVDQICDWNNIEPTTILSICQELAISQPTVQSTAPSFRHAPALDMKKQEGGRHVIQQSETIGGIAYIYGFSEDRFRHFNGLSPTEPAWPGLVLRTSDCNCPNPDGKGGLIYPSQSNSVADTSQIEGESGIETFATWEENADARKDEIGFDNNGFPFGENPYYQETSMPSNYVKPEKKKTPYSYNKEMGKIIPSGNQQNRSTKKTTQPVMDPEVKRSSHGDGAPNRSYISPEEELIKKAEKESASPHSGNNARNSSPKPKKALPNDAGSKMTNEELSMVKEINLVRSNPTGYVKFIEMYKRDIAAGKVSSSVAACDDLIAELKKTPPLPTLQQSQCLFNVAKNHGNDLRRLGKTSHLGSNGSYPWDRITGGCQNMADGNENLVGGPKSIRKSIILLLVDDRVPNRGHRRNLLSKDWKYIACYKIGQVGNMQNNWVQNFGK